MRWRRPRQARRAVRTDALSEPPPTVRSAPSVAQPAGCALRPGVRLSVASTPPRRQMRVPFADAPSHSSPPSPSATPPTLPLCCVSSRVLTPSRDTLGTVWYQSSVGLCLLLLLLLSPTNKFSSVLLKTVPSGVSHGPKIWCQECPTCRMGLREGKNRISGPHMRKILLAPAMPARFYSTPCCYRRRA